MALGASLNFTNKRRIWPLIAKALGMKAISLRSKFHSRNFPYVCSYAGVPTSSNTLFNPGRTGVLCYDSTNSDVYICSAYVAHDNHTWTKISA